MIIEKVIFTDQLEAATREGWKVIETVTATRPVLIFNAAASTERTAVPPVAETAFRVSREEEDPIAKLSERIASLEDALSKSNAQLTDSVSTIDRLQKAFDYQMAEAKRAGLQIERLNRILGQLVGHETWSPGQFSEGPLQELGSAIGEWMRNSSRLKEEKKT